MFVPPGLALSVNQVRMLNDIVDEAEKEKAGPSPGTNESASAGTSGTASAGTSESAPSNCPTRAGPPSSDNKRPQPTSTSTFSVEVSYQQQ